MPWADLTDFLTKYPKAGIFVKGIDNRRDSDDRDNTDRVIETVWKNIINSGFRATGNNTGWRIVLEDGKLEGDCTDLHDVFLEIMEKLNIQPGEPPKFGSRRRDGFCLVTKLEAPILGGRTSNVDNGMWLFKEHWWIEVSGKQIDLLFGGVNPEDLGLEVEPEKGAEDGCGYYQFKSARIYDADPKKMGGRKYAFTIDKGKALSGGKGPKPINESTSCVIL